MLNKFIFFLFGISLVSCSSNLDCSEFKTGNFEYPTNSGLDLKIERTENQQIETSKKKSTKDIYEIIWTSNCAYQLVLIESNQPANFMKIQKDTMNVSIIGVEQNKYRFKATLNNKLYEGELIKSKS